MTIPAPLRASFPLIFVLIWSSGFIVARYGMPHAEPMTFLLIRFVLVLMLLIPIALVLRRPWPPAALGLRIAIAGLLLQAGYLGGVWAAVREGMTAGLVALIMGLQPILTAAFLSLLRERIHPTQWIGLAMGLTGVGLVVATKVSLTGLTTLSLGLSAIALASITIGTLYQKRACPDFDLMTGMSIQFVAAALVCLPFVLFLETRVINWHPEFVFSMAWSVLAISIGAISLLFVLIREGAATNVTSLLYLTPPTTAAMAWVLFDEPITLITLLGTLTTVVGVWLVTRARPSKPGPAEEALQ